MSDFDSYEISDESGEPVELYVFTIGPDIYNYTSAEDDVVVDGTTYEAKPLSRDPQKDGPKSQDTAFAIECPNSNPVVLLFVNTVPGKRLHVLVSRYHRADSPTPTVREIFDGFVESVDFKNDGYDAIMNCNPALAARNREMPRYGYQSQCNNVLYDDQCGVSETNPLFRLADTPVSSVDGRYYTIGAAALYSDGWFTGGFFEVDGGLDHRLIVSHVGDQIEVSHPFAILPTVGTIFAGCAHIIGICHSKFGVVETGFQGCAFVPTRNPFLTGL